MPTAELVDGRGPARRAGLRPGRVLGPLLDGDGRPAPLPEPALAFGVREGHEAIVPLRYGRPIKGIMGPSTRARAARPRPGPRGPGRPGRAAGRRDGRREGHPVLVPSAVPVAVLACRKGAGVGTNLHAPPPALPRASGGHPARPIPGGSLPAARMTPAAAPSANRRRRGRASRGERLTRRRRRDPQRRRAIAPHRAAAGPLRRAGHPRPLRPVALERSVESDTV